MILPDDPDPDASREAATEDELVVVSVTDDAWIDARADAPAFCREAARKVREHNQRTQGDAIGEITIVLADDESVRQLNREYRGLDKPTNVLSFTASSPPIPGEVAPLGDIILGFETVNRESKELDTSLVHHIQHLVVHGCLHLLGYDHEDDRDAERMESLETSILLGLGIPDPYRDRYTAPVDHVPGGAG